MTLQSALVTTVSMLALLTLHGVCSAQTVTGGEPIVVGEQFQLHSERMGEMRTFQVHRPPNYDIDNARYPVVVVLDGEEHFQYVSAMVDALAAAGEIPAMLVVGIPNTDRYRDMDSAAAPGTSRFLTFITDELIPRVDRDYRTRPYRILVGHSGAGMYALYSLVNAPEAFRAYIVSAAAFGENRELPKTIRAFLEEREHLSADVFMAVDDSTGQGLTGAWELASYLQERASRVGDLRFAFRHYPDETHAVAPLRSVHDGLRSIFEGWAVDMDDAFALYEQGGFAAIDRHFAALSERLGFTVPVPEDALLAPFFQYEGLKRFTDAEQVIQRVIASFPDSATARYYAGRLYMQMGNRTLAVENLKNALLLSPNDPASRSLLEYMNVDVDAAAAR